MLISKLVHKVTGGEDGEPLTFVCDGTVCEASHKVIPTPSKTKISLRTFHVHLATNGREYSWDNQYVTCPECT